MRINATASTYRYAALLSLALAATGLISPTSVALEKDNDYQPANDVGVNGQVVGGASNPPASEEPVMVNGVEMVPMPVPENTNLSTFDSMSEIVVADEDGTVIFDASQGDYSSASEVSRALDAALGSPRVEPRAFAGAEAAASSAGWIVCFPGSRTDHIGLRYNQARAHGWWTRGNCPDVKAKVTTRLYAYFGNLTGPQRVWVLKDTDIKTLKQGTSRRTVVSRNCISAALTGWRVTTDVDVVGYSDYPNLAVDVRNLRCRPS